MLKASPTVRFKTIFTALEKTFGRRDSYKNHPPVKQALITLLLKAGKEEEAHKIIRKLEREFVDWNEVRVCEPETLNNLVGTSYPGVGGLIKDSLTAIFNHSQSMNIDDIMEMHPDVAEQRLRRLAPMPSRVAGELLLARLKYQKLPETTGILRVAKRVKLVKQGPSNLQIKALRRFVSTPLVPRVFHSFEMLAERFCTADNSGCAICPICEFCPTGTEKVEKERARAAAELAKQKVQQEAAQKRDSMERFKQAIKVRTKKLDVVLGKRPVRPVAKKKKKEKVTPPVATKMVQASSADVRTRRVPKRKKSRSRARR